MESTTIFRLRHNRSYTTFVETSHGRVKVTFEPVSYLGRRDNGLFSTADDEVVEALKRHREFGGIFYMEEASGKAEPAPPAEETTETNDPRTLLNDEEAVIEETSVTSAQMARIWLQKNFGEVFEATKAADIKAEAASKYNVIFVNW